MGRSTAILRLEREIERIEARPPKRGAVVSTGITPLDTLLPEGGLPRGRVIEWSGSRSSGKTSLLRVTLERLRSAGESVALVDTGGTLFAPDWTSLVEGEGRFWVVRPRTESEAAWCADLLLRSGAFGTVALQLASQGEREGRDASLRRSVTVRLQRLAEEASAVFVMVGQVPLAALRLSFRAGRVEPVRGMPFGPFLPALRPVWVRVDKHGSLEVPLLCPTPCRRPEVPARDRKGPA
jgi:hypothetical protein